MARICQHNNYIWSEIDNYYYYHHYYLKLNFGAIHFNDTTIIRGPPCTSSFVQTIPRKKFPLPVVAGIINLDMGMVVGGDFVESGSIY